MESPPTAGRDDDALPHAGMLLLDPSKRARAPRLVRFVVAGLVAAAVGAGVLLTRAPAQVRADRLRAEAEAALASGRPGDAEVLVRESLRVGEGLPSAQTDGHALLGEVLAALGRDSEADAAFEEVFSRDRGHVETNAVVARRRLAKSDAGAAERHADRALAGAPSRPDLRFLRAEIRLVEGDFGGALEDLRTGLDGTAVAASPAKALLAAHLAGFLARTTDDPALLDAAASALRRFPPLRAELRSPVEPRVVAEWHLASGRPRSALEALAGETPTAFVTVLRAEAHRLGEEQEQAELLLREALAREASPVLHAALVRLLLAQGRARSAEVEVAEASRRHPDDVSVAHARRAVRIARAAAAAPEDLLLAVLLTPPGAYDPVEPFFVQRLSAGARGPEASAAAVQILGEEWLTGAAQEEALERSVAGLLTARPDDPTALAWRGAAALRRGEIESAHSALDRAVRAAPESWRARAVRAAALAAVGRWADVLDDARALSRARPSAAAGAVLETRALLGLGDTEPALASARRATSRWPEDLAVLAALRDVLAASGPATPGAYDRETEIADLRLAAARHDQGAVRRAIDLLRTGGDDDPALRYAGAQLWDDLAAEWGARERETPSDVRATLARASSLVRAGRPRQADLVLKEASARAPDPRVTILRSRVLSSLGGFDEAEAILRTATGRESRPDLALEFARVLLAAGRHDDASRAYRALLAAPGPLPIQTAAAFEVLADERAQSGDADAVERWLGTVPEGALADAQRRLLAGQLALARGRPAEVGGLWEAARGDASVRVPAALLAVRGCLAEGDAFRAEEILVEAMASDPRHPAMRALLAHVRLVLGARSVAARDLDAAARHFERAVTGSELDVLAAVVLADVHLRRREMSAAAEASRRLSAARPFSPAPPMFRASLEAGRGSGDGALPELEEALLAAPGHPAVLASYVDACLGSGRMDDAERACRSAADEGDRLGFATFLLGRLLARKGDAAGAEAALRRALVRDPGNFAALGALADVLRARGRAEEARALVVSVDPKTLPAPPQASRSERLRLYVEAGTVAGACDRLREILGGAPSPGGAATSLAAALLSCGEPQRALLHAEAALAAEPDSFAAAALVLRASSDLGRLDEAERRFAERTAASPYDPGAWCLRGMIESHRGRRAEAIASYRRALAVAPRGALAANNLACMLFEDEATRTEALDLIARTSLLLPQEPSLAATHAWLLLRAGRASGALAVLDEAIPLHPSHATIRLHRAEALRLLGREEAAVAELRSAQRLDPDVLRRAGSALRALEPRTR